MKPKPRGLMARTDHDRGLSEVIAFTLVFAIVLTSVALLFSVGFGALDGLQQNEQLNNAERGMTSLADNFNDILRHDGVEERRGELTLGGGTIVTGSEGATVIENITYDGEEIVGEGADENVSLGEFAYQAHSETIAYEGGSVVRSPDDGGDVMVKQPRLRCNTDSGAATISLTAVNASTQSFQSTENTGLRMSVNEEPVKEIRTGTEETVGINLSTDYETAWDGAGKGWDWDDTGDIHTATCEDIDRVVVHVVTVDVEIEN